MASDDSDKFKWIDYFYEGFPRYVTSLEAYFYKHQRIAFDNAILPDGKWRLCLGVLCYGAYVERFLRYCVPALLAPGNVPSLSDPLVIVHTDEASVETLESGLEALRRHARVEIHVIPQEILDMVPDNPFNKYWLLGTVHNLHMQQAKYRAHGYHMLMPDHIYATGYFENLAFLAGSGKQAIVQGGLSAKMEAIGPVLDRQNGAIEPDRLVALALDNMHPLLTPFLMNGFNDFPTSLLLIMIGHRSVQLISPHMSIAYFSHEVLMRAPIRLVNTVDGQLPFFIPDDIEPYTPSVTDGMVYIEVSHTDKDEKYGAWKGRATPTEFCARFWVMMYCHKPYERYFGLTTELPLPTGYVSEFEPLSGEDIEAIKRAIRQAVSESHQAVFDMLPDERRYDPILQAAEKEKRRLNDAGEHELCEAPAGIWRDQALNRPAARGGSDLVS